MTLTDKQLLDVLEKERDRAEERLDETTAEANDHRARADTYAEGLRHAICAWEVLKGFDTWGASTELIEHARQCLDSPLRLSAPTHAGCPECAARRALEAATGPSERTVTLSTAEINTLLRACAWILYPDGHLYAETHELVESALAKLEAAINPNERQT